MPEVLSLRPVDLLIDEENPRISQPNAGQHKALQSLAGILDKKLQKLCEHIVEHGINLSELPIVMPFNDDLNRYVVLEGNRRLTALKVLETPELLGESVTPAVLKSIRKLSRDYQDNPIDQFQCLVVKDREEARPWIELRHTGENGGAGIVPWGHEESGRFSARSGVLPVTSQALNFLEQRGDLSVENRKKVPVTSLKRLIDTPEVRSKLGLEVTSGKLSLLADGKRVAKALMYVVNRLSSGKTKVTDIYTKDQRIDFAKNLPADVVVKATVASGQGTAVDSTSSTKATAKANTAKKRGKPRDKLIPKDCVLNISDPRLQQIEWELRHLSLADYSNAVSVLIRVFIELSADSYIDGKGLTTTSVAEQLYKKLQAVTSDLIARKKLTAQQAKPMRRALAKDSFLAPSIDLMHSYVHNQHVFPAGGDLRAHWDSFQPFVIALWAV